MKVSRHLHSIGVNDIGLKSDVMLDGFDTLGIGTTFALLQMPGTLPSILDVLNMWYMEPKLWYM